MNKEDLINKIIEYTPYNEQEERDKSQILSFLKTNDNAFLRENVVGHITGSSWIVNKERTKVLMIYHNIYDSWSWTGGHADGEIDLLKLAIREANEETNIKTLTPVTDNIYSLETLTVDGHIKRGKYVSSHLHFNITYLLEASEDEELCAKLDEAKDVKWIKIEDLENEVREKWMMKNIYQKLVDKLKEIK